MEQEMVPKPMLDMVLEQLSMLREQIARMQETIYILMNLSMGGSKIEKIVYLIGHSWYDLTDFMMNDAYNNDESDSEKLRKLVKELGKQGVRNLLDLVKDGLGTETTSESGNIKIEELPNTGLEYIELPTT